jgi:hypothetical protein
MLRVHTVEVIALRDMLVLICNKYHALLFYGGYFVMMSVSLHNRIYIVKYYYYSFYCS